MAQLPAILEAFKQSSGYRWSYIAELLGVTTETLYSWRNGRSLPWGGRAKHLAELVNRPDLVHVVEADRVAMDAERRLGRGVAISETPTPRTLIIPADGAA